MAQPRKFLWLWKKILGDSWVKNTVDLDIKDDNLQIFLKSWFSGLFKGIEKLEDDTWPKLLEMTGRACAQIHSGDLFHTTWQKSSNIEDFVNKLKQTFGEEIYIKKANNTISVSYTRCKCPLVHSGLVDSPIICNCSPSWLLHNFESVLGTNVEVKTNQTILRGAKTCEFSLSFWSFE